MVQHLTYPDDCGILQQCIDDLPCNGGVVEIADDLPILDPIQFEKGLTLRAAPGHKPLLLATLTAAPGIEDDHDGYEIRLEGLTFGAGAAISVQQTSPNPLAIEVVGNTFLSSASAISITPTNPGLGPITFDVSDNAMTVSSDDYAYGIGILEEGDANGRIANNVISIEPGGSFTGGLFYDGSATSDVDIVANRISGIGYSWGLSAYSAGSATVRIAENLVTGQVRPDPSDDSASYAAISLYSDGAMTAALVDNTVAGNDRGIYVYASDQATVSGLLANNIASGNAVSGIAVEGQTTSFLNRNNLVFGNGVDDFTPGPGTVTEDPRFAGPGDYHLGAGSPAIDAGNDGDVPGDLTTDLDGSPRIQGSHVDLGAFETVPEPTTLLSGGATLLALHALGRRTHARTASCWRRR